MPNRDLAYRVADIIERSGTFDMFTQFHPDGQPSCIAGHLLHETGTIERNVQPTAGDIATMMSRLGINLHTAMALCMPLGPAADVRARPGEPNYISKEKAAANLRRVGDGKSPRYDLPVVEGKVLEKVDG